MKNLKRIHIGVLLCIALCIPLFIYINKHFPKLDEVLVFCSFILLLSGLYFGRKNKSSKKLDSYNLTPQRRRQQCVLFWVIGTIGIFAFIKSLPLFPFNHSNAFITSLANIFFALVPMVSLVLVFSAITYLANSRYFVLMRQINPDADERDYQNKNNACRIAYRIFLVTAFIILVLFERFPTLHTVLASFGLSFFWFLLLLAISAPTLVYAWLEPDPIPDNT